MLSKQESGVTSHGVEGGTAADEAGAPGRTDASAGDPRATKRLSPVNRVPGDAKSDSDRCRRAGERPHSGLLAQSRRAARPSRGCGSMTESQLDTASFGAFGPEVLPETLRLPSVPSPGPRGQRPAERSPCRRAGPSPVQEHASFGSDSSRAQGGESARSRQHSTRDNCRYRTPRWRNPAESPASQRFGQHPECPCFLAGEAPAGRSGP